MNKYCSLWFISSSIQYTFIWICVFNLIEMDLAQVETSSILSYFSPLLFAMCPPEWPIFSTKATHSNYSLSHSFFPTEWNKIMGCEDYHALKRDIINEHTHTKYIFYFILFIYLCDAWRLRNGCFIIGTHHRCIKNAFFLLSFTLLMNRKLSIFSYFCARAAKKVFWSKHQ